MKDDIWQEPTTLPELTLTQVHVWCVPITTLAKIVLPFRSILNHDEQQRSEYDQITRVVLRCLLGAYLQQAPIALHFTKNIHGKPMLAVMPNDTQLLSFNVSHTERYAVIAIGYQPMGIDIENKQRNVRDPLALAKRFFHPDEYHGLSALPTTQHHAAFMHTWVCKEAWVKAQGTGLANSFNLFSVEVDPQQPPQIITATDMKSWCYWALPEFDHHFGALVTRQNINKIIYCDVSKCCNQLFNIAN